MAANNKKPYTTGEIAGFCNVTINAVKKWIASGKLNAFRTPGGHFRVNRDDFMEFLKESPVTYPILMVDVYAPPEPFGAPRVLPTTIVLDREGRAVKSYLGPVTREAIERFIDGGED